MKKTLILGNSIQRLNIYNKINKFIKENDCEIWICNEAFKEHKKLNRIDIVGTVHDYNAIKAFIYKQEHNLKYKIFCSIDVEFLGIKIDKFKFYEGWSTGSTLVNEAFMLNYDEIYITGFGSLQDDTSDIYQKNVIIDNFKRQFDQIKQRFELNNIDLNQDIIKLR